MVDLPIDKTCNFPKVFVCIPEGSNSDYFTDEDYLVNAMKHK